MPNLITEGGWGLETDKSDYVICERPLNTFLELLNAKKGFLGANFGFTVKYQFFIFRWLKLTSFWQRNPLKSSYWYKNKAETV